MENTGFKGKITLFSSLFWIDCDAGGYSVNKYLDYVNLELKDEIYVPQI